ncbi:insulinoma-associated protein 1a-like isoform X1 [Euwallacea fornicatus]|uniref:insulinoma-associated protein 1a-like isoform X1 n=1 Tax=Euwallacea fornicatus TaxID=995702 RepID=UPI00338F4A5A
MPRVSYPHHEMEFATFSRPPHFYHQQQSLLQRLGIDRLDLDANFLQFQHYIRYSEPLELTTSSSASPLDLSVKTNQVPITPPCTPSPKSKTPAQSPTPEVPTKKIKLNSPTPKKNKATRKLNFDEDNSSPVSGTIIRELRPDEHLVVRKGDIDPAFNVVEITEEAKAELSKIENHIGDYVCRLCKELYEDAFGLAQHRCSRIVHVEYRCPECDKVFNCPANLASHRRWHKPRPIKEPKQEEGIVSDSGDSGEQFPCSECGKRFRRIAYLRKHQTLHQMD